MTPRATALAVLVMSCAKPSPRVFQVTVDDRYGVYQAFLNIMKIESPVSAQLMEMSPLDNASPLPSDNSRLERFNTGALDAFRESGFREAGSIDVSRLDIPRRAEEFDPVQFFPVGFDPTGTYAVSAISVPDGGIWLFEAVRTEAGHWAVTKTQELALY